MGFRGIRHPADIHVCVRADRLLSATMLFDEPAARHCMKFGLVDADGKQTVSAHRFRHTIGTQPSEAVHPIQAIMTVPQR
jgi:hypothetical protein